MRYHVAPSHWLPIVSVGVPRVRYPSMYHAARALGVRPTAIRQALLRGHRCGGKWWTWDGLYPGTVVRFRPAKVRHQVLCVETGQTWPTLWAASGRDKAVWAQMRRAIKNGRPWRGQTFRIVPPKSSTQLTSTTIGK